MRSTGFALVLALLSFAACATGPDPDVIAAENAREEAAYEAARQQEAWEQLQLRNARDDERERWNREHPRWEQQRQRERQQEVVRRWKQIRIGMSAEQVLELVGKPSDINRSVFASGVHEQWIYQNPFEVYLYFEGSNQLTLRSWQE